MKRLILTLTAAMAIIIIWACSESDYDFSHANPFDPESGQPEKLTKLELTVEKIDRIKLVWDDDYYSNDSSYTFILDKKIGETGTWQEKYKVFTRKTTSFTDSAAGINQLNYYRVRVAYDQNISEPVEASVLNPFPSPANVILAREDLNTVLVRWSDNSNGEDGFIIDRYSGGNWNDSLAIVAENTESWRDSSVVLNDSIRYRIWAFRKNTRSAAPVSQWLDTKVPAPGNLRAESADITTVNISWTDNSKGEDGFKVEKQTGGGAWVDYYTAQADSTSWADHNAVINETVQYRVYAFKGTNNSDYAISNTVDNTFPEPSNLILNQMDLNTIRLDWTDNSTGEDGFVIDRKNSSGVWVNGIQLLSPDIETWTDTPVDINDSLEYRIRAYKDVSAVRYYSVYSSADMNDINFPPPSNLTYTKLTLTSIRLNWTDNSTGEDGFFIDKKVNYGDWVIAAGAADADSTEWTDNSAEIGFDIQYRVYAKAGSNYSNYLVSDVIDNTIPAPTNLSYTKLDINSIRLNWTDNSTGEAGFIIDKSVNGAWTNSYATASANAVSWTDDAANINKDLVYRIKTYSGTNYSSTLETGLINNIFPAPSALSAQASGKDITLNWADNSIGEQGFKIDIKYDGGLWVENTVTVGSNITTWNQTVQDTGKYYYRVKAYYLTDLSATSQIAETWIQQTQNEMILVPAGTFQMGQVGVAEPVHEVTISHSFYMAKYETTQKEWADIMGTNPAHDYGVGDNYPVYYVSWYDILVYCNKRSSAEGLNPCYVINNSTDPTNWGVVPTAQNATWDAVKCRWYENGYRMPTEAEWEYAAQYNDERTYPWGETVPDETYCNFNNNVGSTREVGYYTKGNSELIFCDLAGNLVEFVWDWDGNYSDTALIDPTGPQNTINQRVLKSGGITSAYTGVKCAYRGEGSPYLQSYLLGFRVARNNPADPRPPIGMIEVPVGSFIMGQTGIAEPEHNVNLTRSYYLGKYEITQAEWTQYMPAESWSSTYGVGSTYPAYYISWYEIIRYCNRRSIGEGLTPCYTINNSTDPDSWGSIPTNINLSWDAVICDFSAKGYRLPTEAEWEYAAQYNDGRTYPWGETQPSSSLCNYKINVGATTPVGSYISGNSNLGLCDMAGNVWELVWDWGSNYTSAAVTDPTGPTTAQNFRVIRGGGWDGTDDILCAKRSATDPWFGGYNGGFRVARTK